MNRTLNVVRLQLVNKQTFIWVPIIVLLGSLIVSIAIYGIIASAGVTEPKYGGGAQAPLWVLLFVGISSLTLTFPFSQALSITRREFYLGTLLSAAMTAVILAVVFMLGGLLELATGGWGINGWFFHLPWVWERGVFAAGLFYFVAAMLIFVVGFWCATIYKRFGALWLSVVLIGLGLLLVVAVWLITVLQAWPTVWTGLVELGALGLALWGLLLMAVLAASSFLTLRRAVP